MVLSSKPQPFLGIDTTYETKLLTSVSVGIDKSPESIYGGIGDAAMPFCTRCGKEAGEGTSFCGYCGERLGSQISETGISVTERLSWFHRHLNWTYFLAWLFLAPLTGYLAIWPFAYVHDSLYPPPHPPGTAASALLVAWLIYIGGYLAVMIPVSIYVLRRKGRSLWWMLLVFSAIPFPMFLENRLGKAPSQA